MLVILRMNEYFMRHMRKHYFTYVKKLEQFGCTLVYNVKDPEGKCL